MKETIINLATRAIGIFIGYWADIFKKNRSLEREADLKALEEFNKIYPSDSFYLSLNPDMLVSSRVKIPQRELDKLTKYVDNNKVNFQLFFHDKNLNRSYLKLRALLIKFCKLVLNNIEHAEGCHDQIYAIRGRTSDDCLKMNTYEALVEEIDNLGTNVIDSYLNFLKESKDILKI